VSHAAKGSDVKVHYTGRLDDGTVFDTSKDRDPLSFTLGEGQVISGFENAVEGMGEGESKEARIPAEEAYGERREELILSVPREQFPDEVEPEVGQRLQMQTQEGEVVPVMVADVEEDVVRLDANHPLAGRDLTFDIEVVEVE
jgi:peptidylprolyl isomerase